jgi:hypothetical protein
MPLVPLIAEDGSEKAKHCETVIEAPQHKNAMKSLGQDKQRKYIGRYLPSY